MRKLFIATPALALALALPLSTAAQPKAGERSAATPAAAPSAAEWVAGVVRKVDLAAKSITLKHGEIKSISMPPMTMPYDLKDASLAKDLKAGDAVEFRAVAGPAGSYLITELRRSK